MILTVGWCTGGGGSCCGTVGMDKLWWAGCGGCIAGVGCAPGLTLKIESLTYNYYFI